MSFYSKYIDEDGYIDADIECVDTIAERYEDIIEELDDDYENLDDSDDGIDNTDITYEEKNICIKLNSSDRNLSKSEEILCHSFKNIRELQSENRLQTILDNIFVDGLSKTIYIRKLSNGKNDNMVLGIRPKIYQGDYLYNLLGEKKSLVFKGFVNGRVFVVDKVYETYDSDLLDFECQCDVYPYNDVEKVRYNFLYDVHEEAESLTQYTSEKLDEWNEYLKWKRKLTEGKIHGCKYYKRTFDKKNLRIVFWLLCENKEYFNAFKKYLSRDIHAFNNAYSKNSVVFDMSETDGERRFFFSTELGRFKGIVKEYYLRDEYRDLYRQHIEESSAVDQRLDIDEEEDDNKREEKLLRAFENPYIVQVAYSLNNHDSNIINNENLDSFETDEDFDAFIEEKRILEKYDKDGFLALSAVGEMVLIRRLEQAIRQLENDEHFSPNLAMWLFNVNRARLPEKNEEIVIDKWLNKDIETNENQRVAVEKMLKAPDLCLIQGPPGTGKTTVIAEAIYQFAKQGKRILLASQSNDAVDNALEKLAKSSEIRAIRLGLPTRKKRKGDEDVIEKFSENEVLRHFYQALSAQISEKWIDKWSRDKENLLEYDNDIRDAGLYIADIKEKQKEYNFLFGEWFSEQGNVTDLKKRRRKIDEQNANLNKDKLQSVYFSQSVSEENNSNDQFFLSEQQNNIVYNDIREMIKDAASKGITILTALGRFEDCSVPDKNRYIKIILSNLRATKALLKRISDTNDSTEVNTELEAEIDFLNEQINIALKENDIEKAKELLDQRSKLNIDKNTRKVSSSIISFSEKEKSILSTDLLNKINSSEKQSCIDLIENIVHNADDSFEKASDSLYEYTSSLKIQNTDNIDEQVQIAEGKERLLKEKVNAAKEQLGFKQSLFCQIKEKYDVSDDEESTLIEKIKNRKNELEQKLQKEQPVKNAWEKIICEFKNRLDDDKSYVYDREYYQDVYINACNVVGISCTANMRKMTDKGHEDFDVVIIDEVSKATPPELLIPLMKAQKAILVGDHRQLPPMFDEHEKSYEELIRSCEEIDDIQDLLTMENFTRFKKMVTASLFKEYFEKADESIKHSLLKQYRMHSDISAIINRFYEHRLSDGYTKVKENEEKKHGLTISGIDNGKFIEPDKHAYWIDSSSLPNGRDMYESYIHNSSSACNIYEKYIIIELLKKIADEYKKLGYGGKNRVSIGIISFYQMQVNELRTAFKEAKRNCDFSAVEVDINTVDRFQGKEKNIIITSLVRNNRDARYSQHVIAFERINVAFSRAQNMLVIVGAKHMYNEAKIKLPKMDTIGTITTPVYKNIMSELEHKGCFFTGNKIISAETEQSILKEYEEAGNKK